METFRERTLANRYQPRQHLPPEFPGVLKEYAREVLREQPEDILQWSANYFKRLAREMDAKPAGEHRMTAPALPHLESRPNTREEEEEEYGERLQQYIDMFVEHDSENNGVLPVKAIKEALLKSYGLTLPQALYVLTATQLVEKEPVNYAEFACESFPALRFVWSTEHNFQVSNREDTTVHGLSRIDVQQEFLKLLRFADRSDTSLLSIDQYMDVLRCAPYHLTTRDLRILRVEAELNERHEVNYEEELLHIFDRLLLAEQFAQLDSDD
ncbi:Regulatory subunit of type II PKA R-subunit, putative [Trypanosoma equiperdum]|uniref:RIIa domain-containing protein n=2 Tax=Trypanozoon TaxID=39700 RepID=Q38DT2_TRYB2|nr:hypothetical protein, conserved [Trypanosoma brucei brucei TREU927]EAN77038.1 hypothetical protein, conserved [Trypanosoma brucei brucei TREU927]SCU70878.1 Regulatory subunit of type II PKA R-subunit, putative [Trypanosoma equiperdum]